MKPAVERFVGMFAFALWDREARRLWLGRDRLGIKPLYYGHVGGALVFGSNQAHRAGAGVRGRDRPRRAGGLPARSCVPAPHTIWRGLRKVLPGTLVELDDPRAEGSSTRTGPRSRSRARGVRAPASRAPTTSVPPSRPSCARPWASACCRTCRSARSSPAASTAPPSWR
ncbi:MAG: hypothetical protein R3F59_31370 [Myxococcota bacterium]